MKRRTFLKISLPILSSPSLIANESADTKPEVVFGVIADPQYADAEPRGSRYYRNSLQKLNTAITELNKHPLDFTVTLGDVIDRDFKSFEKIMPLYKKAKAPQTFVLGNHDFDVADEDKDKVMKAIGVRKNYSSKTIGDWMFIYLDGTDVSTYHYRDRHPFTQSARTLLASLQQQKLPQAQSWNGAIGRDQMSWFITQLNTAKKSNKRVIIFNHFPVFPLRDAHNLWNDEAVVNLIATYPNVVAYMNGHNHTGNYGQNKNCHFVNFKGMVETEKDAPFAIVKCYADRIEVDGYDPEPDRKLDIKQV